MQFFARFFLTKMLGYGIIAKFCPVRPSPGRPICQVVIMHKNKSFSALIFYSSKYSIIRCFSSSFVRQLTNFSFSSLESLSLTTLNLHQKGFIPCLRSNRKTLKYLRVTNQPFTASKPSIIYSKGRYRYSFKPSTAPNRYITTAPITIPLIISINLFLYFMYLLYHGVDYLSTPFLLFSWC